MDSYLVAILTVAGIYLILALALNLQFGLTGLINFGVVGFYGLGAYASGIATETFHAPFLAGLLAALIIGAIAGALVALLSLRLSGDFLAIVTLGFAETIRLVFNNEDWLTHGPSGFIIVTRPVIAGLSRTATSWMVLGVILLAALLVLLLMMRLADTPYGRVLRAVREDDLVPATLGKNIFMYRLQAFVLGSAIMAGTGSLYAHYVQTITPDNFTTPVAILVWMSVIVGGAGNMKGTVLGALAVVFIYEGTRFIGPWLTMLDAEQISALRFIIIGVALILMIRFRPEGLLPEAYQRPAEAASRITPSKG
ncbi:branched-chain amino acid ABC transporter permease [Bradyrhizobium diversitatis]|uniref:Branched-chain amino acid ABC transporter permease n=1 Tax=Bradyrhizobium diversitatis TaxID=2755406 RepID=A0ABS0NUQ8_9BRAD|nr:branched-chain amino acid ABC transporter permease [Bradyrhizobium diversitatis]MBH5384744.1 branched-chain amino acid ABC transporter permease [Bradyrhizobium diversitatis]